MNENKNKINKIKKIMKSIYGYRSNINFEEENILINIRRQ